MFELDDINAARLLVRELGEVEPPIDFVERVLNTDDGEQRKPRRIGWIGLISIALVWVLVLLFVARVALPEVGSGSGVALEAAANGNTSGQLVDAHDLEPPFVGPPALGGFFVESIRVVEDGVLTLLESPGGEELITLQQEGTLYTGAVANMERVDLNESYVWVLQVTDYAVVISAQDGVVWTIVAADREAGLAVAAVLPAPTGYSLSERFSNNLDDLADRLGL